MIVSRYFAITLVILFIILVKSQAQSSVNQADFNKLIQILPPAPNAASLGKYGGINLGLSSGTPNINIPIYEFSSRDIKLPISLSYSSSGFKVDEISSRVGMGWRFNAGGVITRTVRGAIDDFSLRYTPQVVPGGRTMVNYMEAWTGQGPLTGAAGPYGVYDDQPDLFNFNVNGYTGSFILDSPRTVNGVTSMQPILLNYSGLTIINHTTANDGYYFKIITEDGVQYLFNTADLTASYNSNYSNSSDCGYVFQDNVSTAWYLDKIIHPNHDTIFLSYTRIDYHYLTSVSETIYHIDPNSKNQVCSSVLPMENPVFQNTVCINELKTNGPLLDEINSSSGGKLKFRYTGRSDCDDKLISSIEVYPPDQNSAIKIFDLQYVNVGSMGTYYAPNTNSTIYNRPFLTGLTEHSPDNFLSRKHSFQYYDLNGLPPRLSFSKDHWGFFNGKVNYTSIPSAEDEEFKYYLPQAIANRDADPAFAQKGLLSSITYPTGGKDSILYEGNVSSVLKLVNPSPVTVSVSGGTMNNSVTYYSGNIVVSFPQTITLSGFRSPTDEEDSTMSYTNITLLDANNNIVTTLNVSTANVYSESTGLFLAQGSYHIQMDIFGNNPSAGASITYMPGSQSYQNVNTTIGGVRVFKVLTFDKFSVAPMVKKYIYGLGNTIFRPWYSKRLKVCTVCPQEIFGGPECRSILTYNFFAMYSNSINEIYTFNNPVSYENVTESFGENYEGGGVEHQFVVLNNYDPAQLYGDPILGAPTSDNSYRNGQETYSYTFKKNGSTIVPVKKIFTHYKDDSRWGTGIRGYVANRKYVFPCGLTGEPLPVEWNAFDCMTYYYNRSWLYPDTVRTQIFDNYGTSYLEETEFFEYANMGHALPTKISSYKSDGSLDIINKYYPLDLTLSGSEETARQFLVSGHINSPILKQQNVRGGNQVWMTKTSYNLFGNGLVLPRSHWMQTLLNPIEEKLDFFKYNSNGKLIEQTKIADSKHVYVWDYRSKYPVAEVINADSVDVAFTSFEADGSGNWTIGSPTRNTTNAITGINSYLLNSDISKSGLNSTTTYIVSYWTRNKAPFTITGSISGYPTKGKTISGWTLYVHKVTGQTTITLGGSGLIDELRLYPANAQMTTYTYTPLVGMTSQCDVGNRITYYEYDGLQRLKRIRDQDYNILKTYEYQYQASSGCGANCYPIAMQTGGGGTTLSYPVGVFSVNGKLLGNASNASEFVTRWNSDAADVLIGTLATGADSLHFYLTLNPGKTLPSGVTGYRYFQVDLTGYQIDGVMARNAVYVDFGDSSGMAMAPTIFDTPAVFAPNTTFGTSPYPDGPHVYIIHNYADNTLKTLTFYHTDRLETSYLDNLYAPATSLTLLSNLRGYLPQHALAIGGSCYQSSTMNSVAGIRNWNSINSIIQFTTNLGDGYTPFKNMNYAQDFMQYNPHLKSISTVNYGYYRSGCRDTSFTISRLKSDWNTFFTELTILSISDEHWNREDLSGLPNLQFLTVVAGNQQHSNDPTNNPVVPIPSSVLDNLLNQVAAGAGKQVRTGVISLLTGGPSRTPGSDAAVALLKGMGWTIWINGMVQ